MEDKQTSIMMLRGDRGGWIKVIHPVGTDPLLILDESMRVRVIKVIYGERGYYGY